MSQSLSPEQLTLNIDPKQFKFADTSSLLGGKPCSAQQQAWVAQSEAKKAAEFGLAIRQPGFNLLALGEPGTCPLYQSDAAYESRGYSIGCLGVD